MSDNTPAGRVAALLSAADEATPGPWHYYPDKGRFASVGSDEVLICDNTDYYPLAVSVENMKYIALANPVAIRAILAQREALLEALVEAEGALGSLSFATVQSFRNKAKAAIALATGEGA